jgi:hypothetical protein
MVISVEDSNHSKIAKFCKFSLLTVFLLFLNHQSSASDVFLDTDSSAKGAVWTAKGSFLPSYHLFVNFMPV